ncbi:MAG: MFS transporter [Actinomycetota bacterium]|nr:MFS transporter [Actinomycetota bacterium]
MRVLRVPTFGALLAGQAVNAVGNWVALIAIWGFAAFRFDAGPGDLALLFVVLALPGAFLGPLLGVPIDRLGPRRTLVLANALGFLDALALTQADSYATIIVLALPLGLIEALASASLDALPPRLVPSEDLVSANALLGGAEDLAIVLGPVVAAVVNARWGLAGAFLADALTFLVGLAVALPLPVGPVEGAGDQSTWRTVGEGVRLARRTDGLRWTLAVASVTYFLWALFGVLEPLYVRDVLGASDTAFALLQTLFGVGLVSAGLVLPPWAIGWPCPGTWPSPRSSPAPPRRSTWGRARWPWRASPCSSGASTWRSSTYRPRRSCSAIRRWPPAAASCGSTSRSSRWRRWWQPPSPPWPSEPSACSASA